MDRIIFHIDVNNAFLSWSAIEHLKRGEPIDLRTISSIVGGDEQARHGIVLAKSIPAKKLGVITAETLYSARRKCPNLVIVKPDYNAYEKYSNELYNYLCNYSPNIERYSIDECFLDMSGTKNLFGDPVELAYKIKEDIKKELGFSVNIGIGSNKICAKMASDFEKPDKVHTLFEHEIKAKMWCLPVEELFMVGKKSSTILRGLNINTIGELAVADKLLLKRYFKSYSELMYNYANGIDNSTVGEYKAKNQSISNEKTSPFDLLKKNDIELVLLQLSNQVGERLRKEGYCAKVITLVLKNSSFESYSHQQKLLNPICNNDEIYIKAKELLNKGWKKDPIRLVGIRLSSLSKETYKQISLFDEEKNVDTTKIQKTMDNLKNKYGSDIINNASLLNKKEGK